MHGLKSVTDRSIGCLQIFPETGRDTDDVTESGRSFHARAAASEIVER